MLFNSYIFIFCFLPTVLIGYFLINNTQYKILWLVVASLFFYAWWEVLYLALIIGSILFNFLISKLLHNNTTNPYKRKLLFVLGICCNLMLLGYYKYANFLVDNINYLTSLEIQIHNIILPLAISFFTFQQIAYLVDVYRNNNIARSFSHYCLFITFFPQLVAGPIVHHQEILPQLQDNNIYKFNYDNFSIGLIIFFIGLFKKVVLADSLAIYVNPVFTAASTGNVITFFEAWCGALGYAMQLYFDFSGYSDMAIGIAKTFNLDLPINFNSPYKASNIIEFWRRWHITLSRFLKDHLYIPLGGNRKGSLRKYSNLLITMVLGGIWHGAHWSFFFWGLLHGCFLLLNHLWRHICNRLNINLANSRLWQVIAWFITLISCLFAWVFFRANDFTSAISICEAMLGLHGAVLDPRIASILPWLTQCDCITLLGNSIGSFATKGLLWLLPTMAIIIFLPNTQQFITKYLKHNYFYAIVISLLIISCFLMLQSVQKSEFLYFDF
ncbi:MAG: membrane-bound O-acyltransferase family protein [Legionellales bacterium]|nr:MAG: membrane-bound O-acyltransferase family protein [Legionellales bacterium]